MDEELRKYYEDRFSMFSTQGWKDLVEDVREMLASTNTLDGATPENVGFKQGEVSIMRWILSLPEMTETAYEELSNEHTHHN